MLDHLHLNKVSKYNFHFLESFLLTAFGCHPGAQLAGKALISPDQLRAQLKGLAEQRILAVLVVDILDCSGSFLTRVRDLVGRNPVLLIGTKVSICCIKCN